MWQFLAEINAAAAGLRADHAFLEEAEHTVQNIAIIESAVRFSIP